MVSPSPLDPTRSPAAFYGAELRRLREKAGLSQQELADLVFISGTYVSQLEKATRRPQEDLSRQLDAALEGDGHLERLHSLVRATRRRQFADYFVEAAEHELQARTILEYAPLVVPGLLQTQAYAKATILAANPLLGEEKLEEHLMGRLERQALIVAPTRLLFWVVLDEAVLRRVVGSRKIMAEQLRYIAELIAQRQVIVQVVEFDAGAHALLGGMISLMAFDDAPPLAYMESVNVGHLVDETALVEKCRLAYDFVRAAALSQEESLVRIMKAVEEHEDASHSQ
ncbi:helix-turn-helix transcriptional regulator [Kitasatospora sp. YST-16]|uniref:helix-turn-helix domain-containing protein n=1 Tax=Kitasatospora sp. YST-16 TaxID=2998080 RepID=UPI00228419A0|nr:helix-turn-helix transcriptional regulator [Kitasatospora sp. YST-16]WAL72490.1 helix-turn-helix transcriptional regulator [Kitasatospora sp. YST-16]WNW38540.1 helix-turn-helix transcriptional regulator [Streptomyces sp. Li-HN-5-13]